MTEPAHEGFTNQIAPENRPLINSLSANWGWLMALGIVFILLGCVALGMSVAMTVATVLLFGVLLLLGGIVQVVDAFRRKGWKSILFHVLIALLYLASGIMLITEPVAGSMVLTAMLGGAFLVIGVLRIMMGFQMKSAGGAWGWLVFAGVVTLILGLMILLQWPVSALWIIGVLVAIEMIFHGWSYVMLALAARSAS